MKSLNLNGKLAFLVVLLLVCSCEKETEQTIETKDESTLKIHAGSIKGYKDGPALEAQFENPVLMAVGPDKSLYIVEGGVDVISWYYSNGRRIRKITENGIVSTFFNADNSNMPVNEIRGIAIDRNGDVFISDGNQIKKISSDGKQVTVVAGDGTILMMKDGPALKASFWGPSGLAFDKNGCLYIMDTQNNAVRMLSNGKISTLAGGNRDYSPTSEQAHFAPKDGVKSQAEFDIPQFLILDKNGNIYVSGGLFPIVRKITQTGVVTTVIGNNNLSYETEALDTYRGITFDEKDILYLNHNYARPVRETYNFQIYRRSLIDQSFTTLASNEYEGELFEGGIFPEGGLNFPTGMVAMNNTLYFCNTGEHTIRKIALE